MSLIQSLRSLPPKQALVLALAEKARRQKLAAQRDAALSSIQTDPTKPPEITHGATSLILDKGTVYSDLYYKKARYKVYWGGRGAAKSWAFAEALIRLTAALPLKILCVREFQNSIKDSSHKILKDTIERLGLLSWFIITENEIRSKTGASFIFKGLHNNTNGIRSTEGIDICWAEEAHSISEASWRVLIPTIRKSGSEIWISFNMDDENDATYQRFIVKERTDSIVHKVNYDSNPFISKELLQEMEDDKRTDYQLYEHIWLGMPRKISNAIIMGGKYRVAEFDDELWRLALRPRLGADFGFAQDPSTLIRTFILERGVSPNPDTGIVDGKRRLYISHEAYGIKVELNEMAAFYDQIPGAREWPIKADSARPETISMLKTEGFPISAAEKWDGSVKDGIAHLRGYDEIIIHTRCPKTAAEAFLWRYKVDPKVVDAQGQPLVLPVVIDKHNHCWDAIRYSLDGEIQKSGSLSQWAKLGEGHATTT